VAVNLSGRNLLLALLLAALIGLAVAATSGDDPRAEMTGLGFAPQVEATSAPLAIPADALPGGASTRSALVMIQGLVEHRLVVWPLAGTTPPQEVDRAINPWPLIPDPAGERVLYTTEGAVMVLDVAARRAVLIGALPDGGKVTAVQWSPDGRQVAYAVKAGSQGIAYVTPGNGTQPAQEMVRAPGGLPLDVGWLPDNRPVVIEMGVGPVGGLEAHYQLFDTATGDLLPLPSDERVLQPWLPWRSDDGASQVYPVYDSRSWGIGACRSAAMGLANADWLYITLSGGSGLAREIAFAVPDVFLGGPMWLRDGRVVFWGVADPACTSTGSGLYVGRPQQDATLLMATDLSHVSNEAPEALWGVPYWLSPDQSLIAWAENDVNARQTTIHLTPLDGGESRPLITLPTAPGAAPFAYSDQQMVLELVWLP